MRAAQKSVYWDHMPEKTEHAFAVISTGGKQYLVQEGGELRVEKLRPGADKKVVFDKVLLRAKGNTLEIGTPYLEGARVEAEYLGDGRAKKIHVIRFHSKTRYRKKKGHRQHYSAVKILSQRTRPRNSPAGIN